jgi:hypothetical protein
MASVVIARCWRVNTPTPDASAAVEFASIQARARRVREVFPGRRVPAGLTLNVHLEFEAFSHTAIAYGSFGIRSDGNL